MTSKRFGGLKNCRKRSGQSLVLALIALTFLTALMGTVTVDLLSESRMAEQPFERLRLLYITRAGIEAAMNQFIIAPAAPSGASQANEQEIVETKLGAGSYRAVCSDEGRKVNINTADSAALERVDPALTPDIVKAILERRAKRPFISVDELADLPGAGANFATEPRTNAKGGFEDLLTVWGGGKDGSLKYYTITALGNLLDEPGVFCKLRQVVSKGADGLRIVQFEQLR